MIDFVVISNLEGMGAQQYGCHWCNCQISAEVSWEPRTAEGYWTAKGAHAAVLFRSVGFATIAPSWCNCSMQAGWRIKPPANTLMSMIWIGQLVNPYLCVFLWKLVWSYRHRMTGRLCMVLREEHANKIAGCDTVLLGRYIPAYWRNVGTSLQATLRDIREKNCLHVNTVVRTHKSDM